MRNCWRLTRRPAALSPPLQAARGTLQLTSRLQHLDDLTQQAATPKWSALEYLDNLTQLEVSARFERAVQRKLRLARLPFFKSLDHFAFAFQPSINPRQADGVPTLLLSTQLSDPTGRDLVSLRCVANTENVLVLGPPGLGKTQLALSLGWAALTAGLSGLF